MAGVRSYDIKWYRMLRSPVCYLLVNVDQSVYLILFHENLLRTAPVIALVNDALQLCNLCKD